MDNLFQYVLHYVLLTIMIVGALLLFLFFPKFVLFLAFIMLGIAIIISTREMLRKREQSSARKAVTLLSFRFHSLVSFIHIYPAICRAVRTPPQNSAKAKEVRSGSGCRKSLTLSLGNN